MNRRAYLILAGLTLALSVFLISTSESPGYTDAYYYYNAGEKFASGEGLTDAYLWIYVNAPDKVPTESHRYWMPLASIVSAVPMAILGTDFHAAQIAFVPFLIGLSLMGMWLGWRLGGTKRHAWIAGLSVPLGGFYLPFWLTSDTFELFGFVGAGTLIALGLGRENNQWRWFALAGIGAALANLARADGLLFVLVGLIVIWWKNSSPPTPSPNGRGEKQVPLSGGEEFRVRATNTLALVGAYFLVMLPWFVRNMGVMGSPLPSGGIGTIFLKGYNDIFSYPAEWSINNFLDWGWGNILQSRFDGLLIAFQTWLAVEGFAILAPFALWALWKRRREGFFMGMIWYAIGLHLAMSVVFTFPGSRGGLFHSSTALLPFWVALGLVGVDDAIAKFGKWRKWHIKEAQMVFGLAVLLLPLSLGFLLLSRQMQNRDTPPAYARYAEVLPDNARIMVNDPAAWHYHTGLIGVTLPDEPLTTALEIAERYCITHLIIDENVTEAFTPLMRGDPPPAFLTEIHHFEANEDVRVYAFDLTCTP